jgi:hypothetical protein
VVKVKALPAIVTETVADNYKAPKFHSARSITRGADVRYEVVFSSEGHDYDVYVSSDGRFVPREDPEAASEEDD